MTVVNGVAEHAYGLGVHDYRVIDVNCSCFRVKIGIIVGYLRELARSTIVSEHTTYTNVC